MSSADLVSISYVKESTMGVTPTSPALKQLRYKSEGLVYNIENIQSAEITPTRVETDTVQVSGSAAGPVAFELSYASFDDFLASALCGAWTGSPATVLQNGTTFDSYTVQKYFADLQTPQYHNFVGTVVDGFDLRMEIGRIVEGSFSLLAFGADQTASQFANHSDVPANTNTPMNAATNFQSFIIDAYPYTGCISSLAMSVKNNVTPRMCIGSNQAQSMKWGKLQITGSMSLYFSEPSNYARYLAGTEMALTFILEDVDGNEYEFVLPRVKFETGEVVAGGTNTDVMMTANWRALYDGSKVMQITRTDAP
jgi:hypothetical protein